MRYFIDPVNPMRGAVSELQGDFVKEIEEEELQLLRNQAQESRQPTAQDLTNFLKYCFAGIDLELSAIWARIDTYRNENTAAARMLTTAVADLTAATNPSLFMITDPPQSGSWGLAMLRIQKSLSNTTSKMTREEAVKINETLVLFGLPEILNET